jgi:hypothetical protein
MNRYLDILSTKKLFDRVHQVTSKLSKRSPWSTEPKGEVSNLNRRVFMFVVPRNGLPNLFE